MNKTSKIIIGILSTLLISGGIGATVAIVSINKNNNHTQTLTKTANFTNQDIQKLLNLFQNQINTQEYTSTEFKDNIKNIVANNLTLNNENAYSLVKDAIYNNDKVIISLNPKYDYSFCETYKDVSLDTNKKTITISNLNLDFFNNFSIVNTEELFNKTQEYIKNRKCTAEQFSQKIKNNDETLIKLIENNLLIENNGADQPIETTNIENIDVKINKLEITLNKNHLKYSVLNKQRSQNITLKNNKIIVNNLVFYNQLFIENTKLNELKNNVQSLINTNQYTLNEFNMYISNQDFKNKIANYLDINESNIETIAFNNNILKISPKWNLEFVLNEKNDLIVNNTIQIENLEFYDSLELVLSNLYTAFNNYVYTKKLTIDDFANLVNTNNEQILNLIRDNLYVSNEGQKEIIENNKIKNFQFINNKLEIELEKINFLKYITSSIEKNISLENNKIIIKKLNYYQPTDTNYFTWDGTKITGLTKEGKEQTELIIPTNCTSIGDYAFDYNNTIKSVIIPGSVTSIGKCAFRRCENLSKLVFSDGLIEIGDFSFQSCYSLKLMTIPNTVKTIGSFAFTNCTSLLSYNVSPYNSNLETIGSGSFKNTKLSSAIVPIKCWYIGDNAFCVKNKDLENLYIYSKIINLKDYSICDCYFVKNKSVNIYFYNVVNPEDLATNKDTFTNLKNGNHLNLYVRNGLVKDRLDSVLNKFTTFTYDINILNYIVD